MKKENKKENIIILLLAIIVCTMSIYFALYTSTLNLNGGVKVGTAKYNVSFIEKEQTEVNITSGSKPGHIDLTNDTITFNNEFRKKGDFFEFAVHIKNNGTINAKLKNIVMSPIAAPANNYLKYQIKYDGTTYNASANNLDINLNSGEQKTIVVRVEQKEEYENALNQNLSNNYAVTFNYEQQ